MKDEGVKGRIAVVTGAASGIGLALAERFAGEGMKLVISDIDRSRLDEDVARLGVARGVEAASMSLDVSDAGIVERLAALAYQRFGAVHLLCNNAGAFPAGRDRPVWLGPLKDWHWVFSVNMMGVVHGIRCLYRKGRPV